MSKFERPRSLFAGMAELSARAPVRALSPNEIEGPRPASQATNEAGACTVAALQ